MIVLQDVFESLYISKELKEMKVLDYNEKYFPSHTFSLKMTGSFVVAFTGQVNT